MSERGSLADVDLTPDERRWLNTMASWTTVRGDEIEAKFDRLLALRGDDLTNYEKWLAEQPTERQRVEARGE